MSVAQQIATDVATLADLLASEARRTPLTLAEARALRDAVGDGIVAPGAGRVLLGALVDSIEIARDSGEPIGDVYGLDEEQLARKIRSLGHAGDLAIREAIAEWRAAGLPDTLEGYRTAGLNIIEPSGPDGDGAG